MMKKMYLFILLIFAVNALFATTIYDIQYTTIPGDDNTYPSPLNGQEVTVQGIVTAIGMSGYEDNINISMPEGGAWNGIYVYMSEDSTLVPGNLVEVTGSVYEYYGLTEIHYVTAISVISHGNPLPAPVVTTTLDISQNEAYEGVLVEVRDVYVSSELNDPYCEWYVVDMTATPCQIDDGFFYLDNVEPPIVPVMNEYWAAIRGIVQYSYNEYQIDPRFPADLMHESAIDDNCIIPVSGLTGNYPNPFNPETTIEYTLVEDAYVVIGIYNIKGEKVNSLVNVNETAGNHQTTWTGTDFNGNTVPSGVYFYMLNGDNASLKKMILLK
jgi:hypothetical protein